MSKFENTEYQLKRARDNLKIAELQKEIADQEVIIANASGFGAKWKIELAESNLARLRPKTNALLAQMQLEDAQIKAELHEAEQRARKVLEDEKKREQDAIRSEEQWKLAEERRKKEGEDRARREQEARTRSEQRKKDREEKERIRAEKLVSLTPEEQRAETNKHRRRRNFLLGSIAVLILLCCGCSIWAQTSVRKERVLPENIGPIDISLPENFQTKNNLDFVIEKIEVLSELEGDNPRYYYLIIHGSLTNPSNETACTEAQEYVLANNTNKKNYTIDTDAASHLSKTYLDGLGYPSTRGQCLEPDESVGTFLVFDVSPQTQGLQLETSNRNISLGDMAAFIVEKVIAVTPTIVPTSTNTFTPTYTATATPTPTNTPTSTATPTPVTLASVIVDGKIFGGPGEFYDVVGKTLSGGELPIYAKAGKNWYLINWNGREWVSASLISLKSGIEIPESETVPPTPTNTPRPTNTPTITPTVTPRPTNTPDISNESFAELMCEQFVTERLLSPASAKFGGFFDDWDTAIFVGKDGAAFKLLDIDSSRVLGHGVWVVVGKVDAQNAFGAIIRSDYVCVMEYRHSNETWYLLKISID